MNTSSIKIFSAFFIILTMSGCNESTSLQNATPQVVSRDDIGYYCNMIVEDHSGPKGQIILSNKENAIWFTSVRDAVAFTLLPGEPKNISAFFVTAMDEADWQNPEKQNTNWISADAAWYVINSERRGGMGQMEAVPFKQTQSANDFIQKYGGKLVAFDDIPENYILGSTN